MMRKRLLHKTANHSARFALPGVALCSRFSLALSLLVGTYTVAACELETITQMSAAQQGYAFTQEKQIPVLRRPLLSEGKLWLTQDDKLVWHIESPVVSTMVFSESGLRQFNGAGEMTLSSDDSLYGELSAVFINVFAGDFSALMDNFSLALDCQDSSDNWTLTLLPVTEPYSSILVSVTLSGSTLLETLAFEEVRGDTTLLQLQETDSPPYRVDLE